MAKVQYLAVMAAAVVAGCNTDGVSRDSLVNQDVAMVSAETAAQNVEAMRGPGGMHGFGFSALRGKFECNGGERHGLTVTRTCSYKDAAGNAQAAFDELTTASVAVHVEVKGTLGREGMTGTIDRKSDLLVTGLAGTETQMTWNGSGSGTSSRVKTRGGATVQYDITETEATKDVVIPVPRTEKSWPLSGTITHKVTVKFTGGDKDGTTETRDVTITFDGTHYATVVVNGETFQYDLAKRGRPGKGDQHPRP